MAARSRYLKPPNGVRVCVPPRRDRGHQKAPAEAGAVHPWKLEVSSGSGKGQHLTLASRRIRKFVLGTGRSPTSVGQGIEGRHK